jgi:acyl dehydratase
VVTLTSTVHNQDGALVLDGVHRYLIRRQPVE